MKQALLVVSVGTWWFGFRLCSCRCHPSDDVVVCFGLLDECKLYVGVPNSTFTSPSFLLISVVRRSGLGRSVGRACGRGKVTLTGSKTLSVDLFGTKGTTVIL